MTEPTLVILAAGMGSRFGGIKQIAAVDPKGHAIIDYSMYDAYVAGFRNIVFIIKEEIKNDFIARVGSRAEKYFNVRYVYQQLDRLPDGFSVPEGRVKPWGTGHAVLCCKDVVDGPFTVINADDFYGRGAFTAVYNYLKTIPDDNSHSMVAYKLKNTVVETGHVARGVCSVENGYLTGVVEHTKIFKDGENARYTEDDETYIPISGQSLVSMNFWGFGKGILKELDDRFPAWLTENLAANPVKCEYFLPFVVNEAISEGRGTVRVLDCDEVWHGVTYQQDLPDVVSFIESLHKDGKYPDNLLD